MGRINMGQFTRPAPIRIQVVDVIVSDADDETLGDLVDGLSKKFPEIWRQFQLADGYGDNNDDVSVIHRRMETDEEFGARVRSFNEDRLKNEKWERTQLKMLKEKYEPGV